MKFFILIIILLVTFPVVLLAQNSNSKLVKAQNLMDSEKYFEADVIFDEILNSTPNKLEVLYYAAYCKLLIGQPDMTIKYLQRLLTKNKNDADAHNLLGLAFERTGYDNEAIEEYSTAVRLEKNHYEAYFNRGRMYLQIDSIELAKKDFNFAKKNKIINPELYFVTGNLHYQTGQYDSALIDLNKIVKYKSDNPFFLSLLGDIYFIASENDTSKLEKAIEYYTKSIRIDSENVNVLNSRSFVYDKLEQTEKGELDKAKIIEIQKKKGINPVTVTYKQLVSPDNVFSVDIPEDWIALISQDNDSDMIIFFDTNFHYTEQNGYYDYSFGGQISYHSKYFDTSNSLNVLQLREEKYSEFNLKRKIFCNTKLNNYREILRKTFNPNNQMMRGLSKYSFTFEDEKFFGLQYFCITTSGKLIEIILWVPYNNYFYYEQLLNYIYESLTIN